MAPQLARITAERVQAELTKLILGTYPRQGLELMVDTGLADVVLPELPAMRLEIDEHAQHKDVYEHSLTVLEQAIGRETDGPDLVLRLAALLHDIGKPATRQAEPGRRVSFHHHEVVGAKMTRKRLRELRYPKAVIDDVAQLVFLHLRFHGYGKGEWTDSAVRRYVTDAGPLLDRLHKLVRSDSTTRNKRRAAALQRSYDDLEERMARIAEREDLARVRPDLDGNAIMELLGIPPGPLVGRAWRHLKELRLEQGPLDRDAAEAELRRWATSEGLPNAGNRPRRADVQPGVDLTYHFGTGDGPVHRHVSPADLDLTGDGVLDAVALDFDGDGRVDDALWDADGDGAADRSVLDLDDDGRAERAFADPSGRGVWDRAVGAVPDTRSDPGPGFTWWDVRGRGSTARATVDSDGDGVLDAARVDAGPGTVDELVCDLDADSRADQLLVDADDDGRAEQAYLSSDPASPAARWDVLLADRDADGAVEEMLTESSPDWVPP